MRREGYYKKKKTNAQTFRPAYLTEVEAKVDGRSENEKKQRISSIGDWAIQCIITSHPGRPCVCLVLCCRKIENRFFFVNIMLMALIGHSKLLVIGANSTAGL